jgi:glycosyltransferase involved in cell wall biosynthesis
MIWGTQARSFGMSSSGPLPKVSVVIPVYNGARYLSAAIDSALDQTYANVEVLVVNDGSDDDTLAIALGYGDRIKLIEQENRGPGAALNAGVAAMTGAYFCWLSHDDVYKPGKIEHQVEFYRWLERNDVVLFSDYETIDALGEVTGRVALGSVIGGRPKLALWRGDVEASTIFAPKSAFDRFGRFDEAVRFTMDYELWMKWSDHLHFIHIPEPLVQIRLHPNQLSASTSGVKARDQFLRSLAERAPPAERALLCGSSHRFFRELAQAYESAHCVSAARHAIELADAAAQPLVSVVMAVLNELDLAERAIRSVLSQSYRNIELIVVVDKFAADFERLQKIAAEHPSVRVLRDDGRGAGAAKNLGIALALGEYIAFLDHDDWFMPTKIALQVSAMVEGGYLVSHTSYLAVYPSRNLGPAIMHSGRQSGMLFPSIMSNCKIAATTAMFHRAIAAAGFRYSEHYDLGADSVLWATIAREYQILGIDVPLTVIEWSDDTAAISLSKQRLGLKAVHDAYVGDPIFVKFPEEIAILAASIEDIDSRLRRAPSGEGDDSSLNADLLAVVFGPSIS